MLAWHDRLVRDGTEEHRGFVVKSEGDGFMSRSRLLLRGPVVFGDPRGTSGYGGIPIRLRAGLHAGEALRHDQDFYGRTVVIVATNQRPRARRRDPRVAPRTRPRGGARNVHVRRTADVTLKGLAGDFEVYPVLA